MLAMLEEARSRNLEFSLPKIMQVDLKRLEQARESFARSAEIAASLGVRLELPELTAREPRRCDFVQSPSLFVAADGSLNPCYYLWHSYSTWQAGTEIRVRQHAFGRVPQDDPLAVWNSEEFVRFRQEAMQEEYARCGDCSVTPCDYVQESRLLSQRTATELPSRAESAPGAGAVFPVCVDLIPQAKNFVPLQRPTARNMRPAAKAGAIDRRMAEEVSRLPL